jgi:hypothetical protein
MLYKIRSEGIEAFCSDLIVDQESNQYAYFLTVSGYQTAVKGILAQFITGHSLSVEIDKEVHRIERIQESHLMKIRKMPSGYCHGAAIPRMAMPKEVEGKSREFLLISRDPNTVKSLFFSRLDEETEFPLHVTWTDWLWTLFQAKEWTTKLKTLAGSYEGYIIEIRPDELLCEITQAFESKISDIVRCLHPGGGNGTQPQPQNLS